MKGSIVVDELIFPITDIVFDAGRMVITAWKQGPVRAVDVVGCRIFDRRGGFVYESRTPLSWPRFPPGCDAVFTVAIKLTWAEGRQMAWSEAQDW